MESTRRDESTRRSAFVQPQRPMSRPANVTGTFIPSRANPAGLASHTRTQRRRARTTISTLVQANPARALAWACLAPNHPAISKEKSTWNARAEPGVMLAKRSGAKKTGSTRAGADLRHLSAALFLHHLPTFQPDGFSDLNTIACVLLPLYCGIAPFSGGRREP
jgi:hypothetical protein